MATSRVPMIDELIRLQAGDRGEALIERIDHDFLRHGGHSKPIGHSRWKPTPP